MIPSHHVPGASALGVWVVVALIVAVNLPFGFWRAGLRKFTFPWFVAVHAPVPLAIGLRMLSGLGWRLKTFPLFVVAYFADQFLGGKLRARWDERGAPRGLDEGARLCAEFGLRAQTCRI